MGLFDLFQAKAGHLSWLRLEDSHVEDGRPKSPIAKDEAYFVIRMKEMYLRLSRRLWRRFYPLLHGFVEYQGREEHAVAGPGQLRDLGEANLEQVINLNYRLAGPTPFRGGDVTLLAGLYAVPGEDAAKALLTTVSTIASLGGIALGQVPAIAVAVKSGVESIIGLDEATLQLGVRDTFYANNPLREGCYVAMNAEPKSVDSEKLWLWQGRLHQGEDPIAGKPFELCDYMVLEVERRDSRDDWPGLPGIAELQEKFAAIMGDTGLPTAKKREKLGELWPHFQNALATSDHLVRPDAARIALAVQEDLKGRLAAMDSGNPFETRSWRDIEVVSQEPGVFDFLDVADVLEPGESANLRQALAALEGTPFS